MTTKTRIKVVTSADRERPSEPVADTVPTHDSPEEKAQDSATVFGKWIREWRQEKRKGGPKRSPLS